MEPALVEEFARLERSHWWFQGRREVLSAVLADDLPALGRPLRIFDAGSGTGEMVDALRPFGTVAAIDVSPEAVAHCRSRFGPEVAVSVGRVPDDLPAPGTVDVVTAFDVLEHVPDDAGALTAMRASLAPGGTLVATVPALQLLWGPHDVASHHHRRYTRGQLRDCLEAAGFAVIRLTYFNTWLFPMVAAVRLGRRLIPGRPQSASDFNMPPALVNRMLRAVFASEAGVLRRTALPIGVSLLAVARRGDT